LNSPEDIDRAGLCIACGLCPAVTDGQVRLVLKADGFLHPRTDHINEQQWEVIRTSCPGLRVKLERPAGIRYDRLWGPLHEVLVGHATDHRIRHRASSGGAITALLLHLLESGNATAVLHIGPSAHDPLELAPGISRSLPDLLHRTGSRYAPAAPLAGLHDALSDPAERLAVVCRPCDVAALRQYLKHRTEFAERVMLIVSFFCAGTPSLLATETLLQRMGITRDTLESFRYRGCGWPGRATARTSDGREASLSYQESWGEVLNTRLHNRCKICADGIGCLADIVCADAWEASDGYPEFPDSEGRSLILVRSQRGSRMLHESIRSGLLGAVNYDLEALNRIQAYQRSRRSVVAARLWGYRFGGASVPRYQGLYIYGNIARAGLKEVVRSFFGSLKRAYRRTHG